MLIPSARFTGACVLALLKLKVMSPAGASVLEQIVLRWVHIVSAICWLGILYYLILAGGPMLKSFDPEMRAKVFPQMASRALWWLRWGAVLAWVAGFRYFMILAQTDAVNAGRPHAWAGWLGNWFVCWLSAFAIEMALIQGGNGVLGNKLVAGALVLFVMTATSWLVVSLLAQPGVSNRTLSISIGGGLGTILLFNVWGIAWRCQNRLIAWTCAFAEHGAPMPPEAAKFARIVTITMELNFWISFPMVFFMAASAHYPFLSGE
jgi:uncharacterized membrane protein